MSDDIIETAVNWDHDTGEIHVDTRRKSVESKLVRLGLKPIRSEVNGYTSFRTDDKTLIVSFRAKKRLSEKERGRRAKRLRNALNG